MQQQYDYLTNNNNFISKHDVDHTILKNNEFSLSSFKEGDNLFDIHGNGPGLYYLTSGLVKLVVKYKNIRGRTTSSDFVAKIISRGEFFGLTNILTKTNDNIVKIMAIAMEKGEVYTCPLEKFESSLLQTPPIIQYAFLQAVSQANNILFSNQENFLASVQERIAHQIYFLASRFGTPTQHGIEINLKLNRSELAQLASTINESLSRHLTEFKEKGIVDLQGKKILIKDMQALKTLSGNL